MDKETLSNYGWIVICVLVLAVMIALATPFGKFVSNAVQNTTQGLFDVNQKALNQTGLITIEDQEFDVPDMNHGTGNGGDLGETPVEPEPPVEPQPIIITFTIAGIEYRAEEGMTWDAWEKSEYYDDEKFSRIGYGTTDTLLSYDYEIMREVVVSNPNGRYILIEETITNGTQYLLIKNNGSTD